MKTQSWRWTWQRAIADPVHAKDLRPSRRHVASVLVLHMGTDGGSCFPSVAQIASETGLSERTVQDSIHDLERLGWLHVVYGGKKDGKRLANAYTATLPKSAFRSSETGPEVYLKNWGRVQLAPRRVQLSRQPVQPFPVPVQSFPATGATTAPQVFNEVGIEKYKEVGIEGRKSFLVDDGLSGYFIEEEQDPEEVRF